MKTSPLRIMLIALIGAALACNVRDSFTTEGESPAAETAIFQSGSETEEADLATRSAEVESTSVALTQAAGVVVDQESGGPAGLPAGARGATIEFDTAAAVFDGPGLTSFPIVGCWPPHHNDSGQGYLHVLADGTLIGQCANADDKVTGTGTLTGQHGADTLSFDLLTTTVRKADEGNGTATVTLDFSGSAPFDGAASTGSAHFAYACAAQGDGITCTGGAQFSVTGTVPFTIIVAP